LYAIEDVDDLRAWLACVCARRSAFGINHRCLGQWCNRRKVARALIEERFGIPAPEWDVPFAPAIEATSSPATHSEEERLTTAVASTLIAVLAELRTVSATLAAVRNDWAPTTPKLNGHTNGISTHSEGK